MMLTDSIPDQFSARAALVIETFSDVFHFSLTSDASGAEQLAIYIELVRDLMQGEQLEETVTSLGAFLGETIIKTCHGKWTNQAGWWGVQIADGVIACPFTQVRNQMQSGMSQSVARYLVCLQQIAENLPAACDFDPDQGTIVSQLRSELARWETPAAEDVRSLSAKLAYEWNDAI